jgi:uncharacterized membrane protein
MTIAAVFQIIFGLFLALFIPGFLLVMIVFPKLSVIEKAGLSIAFSIVIDVMIALMLGYNRSAKISTGGITTYNVWTHSLGVTGILLMILLIKYTLKKPRRKNDRHKKD